MEERSAPVAHSPLRRWRRIWLWTLLLCGWCPLWITVQWVYEKYEIWQLDRIVDDQSIPGDVIFKDGRNNWIFNSNGAHIRLVWIIVTEDPDQLRKFVDTIDAPEEVEVTFSNVGDSASILYSETFGWPEDKNAFMLLVRTGRGPYFWEMPD